MYPLLACSFPTRFDCTSRAPLPTQVEGAVAKWKSRVQSIAVLVQDLANTLFWRGPSTTPRVVPRGP